MAGVNLTAKTSAITLTASATKTLLQLVAASNHRVLLHQLDISFNGVTAADPSVLVEILVQSTAGTMSSLTPGKYNSSDDESLQTTAQHTATVEPTAGTILWGDYVHMQTGLVLPFTKPLPIPGGTRLGVRYTSSTITATTSAVVTALCEE